MKIAITTIISLMLLFASAVKAGEPDNITYGRFSVGVRGGLTISSVMFSPGFGPNESSLEVEPEVVYGGQLGLVVNYRINRWLYFQPGITYSMQGSKTEKLDFLAIYNINPYDGSLLNLYSFWKERYKEKVTLHYIKFPLLLSFRSNEDRRIQFLCDTGPYLAAGVAGSIDYSVRDIILLKEEAECKPFFEGDKYKRFDAGWHLGIGIKVKKFYVGGYYEISFVDLRDWEKKLTQPYLNSVGSISLGYDFAIKRRN